MMTVMYVVFDHRITHSCNNINRAFSRRFLSPHRPTRTLSNTQVRKYDLSALTRTIRGERISHAGRFRLLHSELDDGYSEFSGSFLKQRRL